MAPVIVSSEITMAFCTPNIPVMKVAKDELKNSTDKDNRYGRLSGRS